MKTLSFVHALAIIIVLARVAAAEDAPLLSAAPGSPVAIAARAMAAGDVNGDRRDDLVLGLDKTLIVFFGRAEGAWPAKPDVSTELAEKMSEIVVADLNHDGRADLVLADHDSYAVGVMLGGGDGTFKPAPGSPFAARDGQRPHTHGLLVIDVNGDGHGDVVTANNNDGDLSVLLGDGKGGLTRAAGSPFPCGPSPYPIAAADLNGDGHGDVVVPNSSHDARTLHILLGDKNGRLTAAPNSPIVCVTTVRWATCGDLSGDGRPDVLAPHSDNPDHGRSLTVLLNQGHGKLAPAAGSPLPIGHYYWGVEIADMNRDGKSDLVVGADTGIRVFLGDGRGGFAPAPGSPFQTGKGAWRVTVADFNGDGKSDVATRCIDANRLEILYGN